MLSFDLTWKTVKLFMGVWEKKCWTDQEDIVTQEIRGLIMLWLRTD